MSQNVPPPRAAGSQPVKQPDTTSRPAQQTASNLPTPFLSPSISTEPSPAFSLQTPAGSEVDEQELLDLGPPVDQDPAVWHIPECWGHRGASADFRELTTPLIQWRQLTESTAENTHASFVAACKEGADGIETGEFAHDLSGRKLRIVSQISTSRRTMSWSASMIPSWRERPMELVASIRSRGMGFSSELSSLSRVSPLTSSRRHVRTKKEPQQPIPQFKEVLDILMEPANRHVKLNVSCLFSQCFESSKLTGHSWTARSRTNLSSFST